MKVLKLIESTEIKIQNTLFFIEMKKVVKTRKVRSADPRAGNYTDNNFIDTVAFVNGKDYMSCPCIETVTEELKEGGYKFFI